MKTNPTPQTPDEKVLEYLERARKILLKIDKHYKSTI